MQLEYERWLVNLSLTDQSTTVIILDDPSFTFDSLKCINFMQPLLVGKLFSTVMSYLFLNM